MSLSSKIKMDFFKGLYNFNFFHSDFLQYHLFIYKF